MNPSLTPTPPASGADKRREERHPGKGNVRVQGVNPPRLEIEGRLVDVSASGFRMVHECSALTAGQFVEFAHVEAKGRARVVWTRIVSGSVESGFVIAAD
jgi:hypothetical protein